MKNNLFARFMLILALLVVAALCLYYFPLKPGIDLGGGTSLLYEVQIPDNYTRDPAEMTTEVINTLKNRVDPLAQKNLIWRVVGGRRIQLQIPQVPEKVRDARNAVREAEATLRDSGLTAQDLANISNATGKERDQAITRLSVGWDKRETLLKEIAKQRDMLRAAEAEANAVMAKGGMPDGPVMEKIAVGRKEVQRLQTQLFALNVNVTQVKTLLESEATSASAKGELEKIVEEHPAQRKPLEDFLAAHARLDQFRDQNADSPEEIQRLLQGSGKLDFRICVAPGSTAELPARQSLAQLGPRKPIGNTRWFEIDRKGLDNFKTTPGLTPHYVVDTWGGKQFVLLYTDAQRALTHDIPGRDWRLTDAYPDSDPTGQTVVAFKLDNLGGSFFSDLTKDNTGKPMAILLDDKAMQAPNINSPIPNGQGIITFGRQGGAGLMEEVENLVKILRAGSLSAALVPEPISVQEISPSLGQDNIDKGVRSAILALLVVIVFMFAYYTLMGLFADVAVIINLVITVAVMALLGATFTLPGIAGLVLTLGMAVDANVLINERIREEMHKGGSLWMAVKQGYDKVFWTIFDSNLTTALTSVVLIFVGSEEVKGFGITLMIGLAISMFTALFVTRTLMIAAVRWGIVRSIDDHSLAEYFREIFTCTWIRGHWPFMRVVTVTNIDWISKRYYFWAFSAVISVAGLVVFWQRGEDKYDTEFRGGTQVTFSTPEKTDIDVVRGRVREISQDKKLLAEFPEFAVLDSATVYAVNTDKAPGMQFELTTEIADTTKRKIKKPFLDALADKFPNEGAMVKINTGGIPQDPKQWPPPADMLRTLMDAERVVPIKVPLLSANFPSTMDVPPKPVDKYVGGVAMYFDQLNPPQKIEDLTARLKATKTSSGGTFRTFEVIPAHEAGAKDGKPLYDAVAVVAFDDQIAFDPTNLNSGWDKVAEQELRAVLQSFEPLSPFIGVNSIDAVVASQAKGQALLAIVISLALIVIYVWIRFGGIRYGYGAILSLAHDAIMALSATVLAKYMAATWLGEKLLISDFKINLTMVAAYLTVIGYSVNDTIVIFDRIREKRGRSTAPLTPKLVNDSINECFGRTIWTTFTVFSVLVIMYIWGGEGVRGFSFAMLVGVFTGVYSTLAIASPMLLSVKEKVPATSTLPKGPSGPDGGVSTKAPVTA